MTRSARFRLIDWVLNDDMEGLAQADASAPCPCCGRHARTYSLGFAAAMHLRCAVRLWESWEAHEAAHPLTIRPEGDLPF